MDCTCAVTYKSYVAYDGRFYVFNTKAGSLEQMSLGFMLSVVAIYIKISSLFYYKGIPDERGWHYQTPSLMTSDDQEINSSPLS